MEKTERDDLEALARDAGAEPWCLHPNGTSVWTGDEYDTEGKREQHKVCSLGPGAFGAGDCERLEFIAAVNHAVVLELLEFYGLSDVVSGGSLEDPDEICAVCGSATDTGHTHEECFKHGTRTGALDAEIDDTRELAEVLGVEYQGHMFGEMLQLVEQLRADATVLARALENVEGVTTEAWAAFERVTKT